jgi:hypothetical protein
MKNINHTRRNFLKTIGIGLVAANVSGLAYCSQQVKRRPNVLFIAVDDLNDWIGCISTALLNQVLCF